MNLRRLLSLLGIALTLGGGLLLSHVQPVHAQTEAEVSVAQVGETANLGSADPRVIATRIINIFLGFLGIVLVCIVIYAGFRWLTAGGDAEKVEKAQKTLRNAIIGLIIIACSWGIVTFLLKKFMGAVQGDGGTAVSSDSGTGSELGAAGGSLGFQVKSITPAGTVRIRNVEVRFLFSREVSATTVSSSIQVVRASDGQPVAGAMTVNEGLVTFVPSQACPTPNGARKCFDSDTEYIARVTRTLRSRSGLTIACGAAVPACETRFKTGSLVDVNAPNSTITTPIDGQGIPQGDTVRVTVRSSDEGGISLTDVIVDGKTIGRDSTTATTTPTAYDATVLWDTRGVATGTHRIEAHVWDIDSNSVTTTPITVVIRPRNYFNGVQDGPGTEDLSGGTGSGSGSGSGANGGSSGSGSSSASGSGSGSGTSPRGGRYGETGVDCGGPGGGLCAGAACTRAYECASSICTAGRCVDQPVIGSFSPVDGRPGTYVTITGVNFGSSTGQVLFAGRPATAPAACTAQSSFWSPTQIVVAVPAGATTSSLIQVTNASNRLSDATNDDRGPRLTDFQVNGVARPGLCAIRPGALNVGDRTRLAVAGTNLGSTAGQIYFNDYVAPISAWRPTGVDLAAPLVPAGGYAVRARIGELESNPVTFQFNDRILTALPVIDALRPATGTVGSYVTLLGRNFGGAGRVFFRNPVTNAVGEADTNFPAQCGTGFWRDTAVMVKVPRVLRGGLNEEQAVAAGRYEIYLQRDSLTASNRVGFTVFAGSPGPGICSIQPTAGPVGTGVTILGEHFGSSVGSVTFAGSTTTRPNAFLSSASWRDGEIRTRVPAGASTGMVRVSVNGQLSNDAFFSVASCLTTPGVCGTSGACCPDGSCAVGGVCQAVSVATSTFAWRTSTGPIVQYPRVVEECNNQEPPSPSPRGSSICINAQAVVRFTTHIERSTINLGTVIVRRCTGTTGDPCATGTPEVVPGTIGFVTGVTQDHLVFTPTGNTWAPSSTYQIILTTGIRSTSAAGSLAMQENAADFGRGNAYAYRFQTREASRLCTAGSVSVVPSDWTMQAIGERKEDYTLSARSSEDICVQINGATLGWDWSLAGAPGRASIEPSTRDLSGAPLDPTRTDIKTVVGRAPTEADPVLVNVSLVRPAPPVPVRGTGTLNIRVTPPRVISYAPNCDDACVNAAVWARFNVPMNQNSLFRMVGGRRVANIEIKRCTNESCRETDRTLDLSQSIIDLITPPGSFATDTMLKLEPSVLQADPRTGAQIRVNQLEPGKYYTATVIGGLEGVRSATSSGNLPLTDLNDSDPLGFTWKFRVKTGPNAYCAVAKVDVSPGQKYEVAFGLRQLFYSSPVSAPDSCSRDGQMLITERSTDWDSSDKQVADFVSINAARESISLADRLPNSCTNQCLNAGSNGVYGRSATCGNSVIETTDTNFCHQPSSALPCVVGSTTCVTNFGRSCVILPEGSQDSEECDLGTGNGTGGSCSSSCLSNPVRRVTDLSPGTCGNGTLQEGEQCDTGRACVGGPTPGRDCTATPTSCGTGGTCQVIERRGCSDRCQALGANRGGSTCGNGDVSDGETCDYRSGLGSGCTTTCLHRGSSAEQRRLCGNGRIEAGESCEVQTAGNFSSNYCGPRGCSATASFTNKCDPQTCLNLGSNRCARASDAGCCGNNVIEAGEDCDGGAGCSNRCLLLGSSPNYPAASLCGDRSVGVGEQCDAPPVDSQAVETGDPSRFEITNRQLFEIVGLREPNATEIRDNQSRMISTISATYQTKTGNAIYGVQCNYSREADCRTTATGLTGAGCCAVRPRADVYPREGSGGVCRNVLVTATFNQLMDEGTIRGNFLVATQAAGADCPTGTTRLDRAVPTAFNWSKPFSSFIARLKLWFSPAIAAENSPWCTGTAPGTVVFETNDRDRKTTAAFLLDAPLQANTQYQVTLLGDPAIAQATTSSTRRGIRGRNGVYTDGNISWRFTTGERICTIDELRLTDTFAAHPTVFYKSNEAHQYFGRAVSYNNAEVVPLSPIRNFYDWVWRPWLSSRPAVLRTQTATTTPQVNIATTTAQNIRGTSLIATGVTITADRVTASSTAGRTLENALLSTVLLCDNPWVPPGTLPGQPPRFEDDLYHFAFNYCLDANQPGITDDLPELSVNRLSADPSDASRGVKRQYIFSFAQPSFRGDAIGVRVMANPLHLSPKDWYLSQGFAGTPQSITVDGYEAIRDGSTVYVSASNVDSLAGNITTDIYVFSHNPNAAQETRTIFDQILASLNFNTNVLFNADNVCRTSSGEIYRASGSSNPTSCTADWECVRYDAGGFCASAKDKLQRDLKRMADLQYMSSQLESTKTRTGKYPVLSSGTFLQTFVTSRWPSWQSVFAADVGKALPEDPLNVHVSCGRCVGSGTACMEDADCGSATDRCAPVEGFDPSTCWSAVSSTYRCPVLSPTNPRSVSRLYQYRSIDNGSRYELGTELEYQPIEAYSPSILPETRRCVSTGASNGRVCLTDGDCRVLAANRTTVIATGVCTSQGGRLQFGGICRNQTMGLGGICGDGVVGTGETCEPGQTRDNDCPIGGVATAGRRAQVCQSDCSGYVDAPGSTCVSKIQCGNNRIETGESCDDGSLNGTYGHCNRTCSGFAAICGDGQLSAGETCDNGATNGNYCDVGGASTGIMCSLSQSCSLDCRDTAPHCGDNVVQTQSIGDGGPVEECDGNAPQTYTGYVCSAGKTGQACDPANRGSDCAYGSISGSDLCGRVVADQTCSNIKQGLCAGGIVDDTGVSHDRMPCSCPDGQQSCPGTAEGAQICGAAYRCVMYSTQRTRSCLAPGESEGSIKQCHWKPWSQCRPANYCGDGVLDAGETCDDGNRNDNDACTNRCVANVCGDGIMNIPGGEECDYGRDNGRGCTGAEYGSTCAACTNQCRMTASSGGYCGNGQLDGSEQCDSTDFGRAAGIQSSTGLTCSGLGFDYAERSRCTDKDNSASTIEVASTDIAARCAPGTARDIISCGRSCGYNGCASCTTQTGTATITGIVHDAVYSTQPVAGATVTLTQNGRRITSQPTNAEGRFTFNALNGNNACGSYRLYVEFARNNPATADYDESLNGGYWTYESNLFSVPSFLSQGIENDDGFIYLIPRVGAGEAMAVHTWNGSLNGRYLLAHLILPPQRAYNLNGPSGSYVAGATGCGLLGPVNTGSVCLRDIHEQNNDRGFQGDPDITRVPYARLFCPTTEGTGSCYEVNTGPQAVRYKIRPNGGTGTINFFITDQVGTSAQNDVLPSYRYYADKKSHVWVVTQDRIYKIDPPTTGPTTCSGKYWLVYQQDVATGAVTPKRDASAYLCGGQAIPGEISATPNLPTNLWPTLPTGNSWLHFGGRGDYSTIDWDMPRS